MMNKKKINLNKNKPKQMKIIILSMKKIIMNIR